VAEQYNMDNYDPLKDEEYWIGYFESNTDSPEDIKEAVVEAEKK
jgi:hypothetical protein